MCKKAPNNSSWCGFGPVGGRGHFRLLWIILSALLVTDDLCVLAFYHLRSERHAEEELDRALREILGQLTARHYLHSLMTIRAG